MTRIKLINEDGVIKGIDPDTGNKVPIEYESLSVDETRTTNLVIGQQLNTKESGPVLGANHRSYTNQYAAALGSIPVNRSKPIVVLRSDRIDQNNKNALDAFSSRRLPWCVSLTPGNTALEEHHDHIRDVVANGAEVALYGGAGNSLKEDVDDLDDLIQTLLEQKRGIEDKGFNCNYFGPRFGQGFQLLSDWVSLDESHHRMIESLFLGSGLSNLHSHPSLNPVGPHRNRGIRLWIDPNNPTQTQVDAAKSKIDNLIKLDEPAYTEHFFHARAYTDNNAWGVFNEFLDKLQTERDNGNIQVVTPTFSVHAACDPSDYNIVTEPTPRFPNAWNSMWAGFRNFPEVSQVDGHWILGHDRQGSVTQSGLQARTFDANVWLGTLMVQVDAKSPPSESNDLRIRVDNIEYVEDGVEKSWGQYNWTETVDNDTFETYYFPIGFPRSGGGSGREIDIWADNEPVHVKNIKIYPI